jgi:hypothetical protein
MLLKSFSKLADLYFIYFILFLISFLLVMKSFEKNCTCLLIKTHFMKILLGKTLLQPYLTFITFAIISLNLKTLKSVYQFFNFIHPLGFLVKS